MHHEIDHGLWPAGRKMVVVAVVVAGEDRRNLGVDRVDGTGRSKDTWSWKDRKTEGPGKEEEDEEGRGNGESSRIK